MAFTMDGAVLLPADPATVWARLNDPETLRACIPGCETLDKISDTEFRAVAKIKLGPVKASFKGRVTLEDLDPPHGYTIRGEGEGGVAGFAKGGARVRLSPTADGGTELAYAVEAHLGGKIAQLGGRLIGGVAKKLADEFFANFVRTVGGVAPPE